MDRNEYNHYNLGGMLEGFLPLLPYELPKH